ncbi:C40 family peptidase [Pseudomonas sp. LRF_L74]|uniref:C40 family peptidase n=1 Tax=Pseudomonas sp. LRF_L74 TaxID=3369422 RepID=UPI003F5F5557
MLTRFAPLVPIALTVLLAACASPVSQSRNDVAAHLSSVQSVSRIDAHAGDTTEIISEEDLAAFADHKPYELPSFADSFADSILEHGLSLVGTKYRFGGRSADTGFDCSGFVGFLFREEAGIKLPRSTREMINLDAPLIARDELKPGDVIFFNNRGRGRVSHAGIYLGDDQFIHSSSRRSGGVRVDSLDDSYWSSSFMEAKRVLAMAPVHEVASQK